MQLLDDGLHLFGDGAVQIVPTPGHTPGDQSLVVDGRLVLVGDACYCQLGGSTPRGALIPHHPELQRQSFAWLREQATQGRQLVFSHDLAEWESLPETL